MAENKETTTDNDSTQVATTVAQNIPETNPSNAVSHANNEKHQNGSLDGRVTTGDRNQSCSQFGGARAMVAGLPPIDLNQLTTILLDPSMPSQEIMKEVADKIMSRHEEHESDDNSVCNTRGVIGMKGLLDCIFDVTIQRPDSDNSDDDETFQRIPREIPCSFCNKIFRSTMKWKTHVLVKHQDPSVLNIRQISTSEGDKKDRVNSSHRRHSRNNSKPDSAVTDSKTDHPSKTDGAQLLGGQILDAQIRESCHDKQAVPGDQRQSPVTRSTPTVTSDCPSAKYDLERQVQEVENKSNILSCEQRCKDVVVDTCKTVGNTISTVNKGIVCESPPRNIESADGKVDVNSPVEASTETQTIKLGTKINISGRKTMKEENEEDCGIPDKSSCSEMTSFEDSKVGMKRKAASPIQEFTSSMSSLSETHLHSKRSKTHAIEESEPTCSHELE